MQSPKRRLIFSNSLFCLSAGTCSNTAHNSSDRPASWRSRSFGLGDFLTAPSGSRRMLPTMLSGKPQLRATPMPSSS